MAEPNQFVPVYGRGVQEIEMMLATLEEHTVYKVSVKITQYNIEHESILFMGYRTGSYCEIYNNSYDIPVRANLCYYISVTERLTTLKTFEQ